MIDSPDVLALFNSQCGLAAAKQLRDLGLSPSTIHRAQQRGVLSPILPGVYIQPGIAETFEVRAMAAQLLCGPRSFLSGTTAGRLLGLRAMRRKRIDITRPATSRFNVPAWIRPRYAAFTPASDVMTLESGHRVSCPLLTLFTLGVRAERVPVPPGSRGRLEPEAHPSRRCGRRTSTDPAIGSGRGRGLRVLAREGERSGTALRRARWSST